MRKKFTMLFAALLACVGVMAQIPAASPAPKDGEWSADTKWYVISGDNGKFIGLDNVDDAGNFKLTKEGANCGPRGLWCVVGDEENGYKFYNYVAGTSKVLGATGSNAAGRMKLYDVDSNIDGVTYCFDFATIEGQTGYAFVKNHDSENDWWNQRDGYLAYWNHSGAKDKDCTGSQYVFTEVDLSLLSAFANGTEVYFINNGNSQRNGRYLGYDEDNERAAALSFHGAVWTIKSAGEAGEVKLFNNETQKYLGAPGAGDDNTTPMHENAEDAAVFKVCFVGGDKVALVSGERMAHLSDGSNYKIMNYWSFTDKASLWKVEKVFNVSGVLTVGKYYQIHSSLGFAETKAVYSDGEKACWKTLDSNNKSFYWEAVATDGGIALKNESDGKFLQGHGYNAAWTMASNSTEAALHLTVLSNAGADSEYGIIVGEYQMHAEGHSGGAGSEGNLIGYSTTKANSASAWYIREVELPEEFCAVTYSFVYNVNDEEKVYSTTTFEVSKGATYPAVVVPALPYGVSVNATTPEGNVTESNEYKFTLELTTPLPFEAAADVPSIDKWYHLKFAGEYYLYYSADDVVLDATETSVDANAKEAYSWAFVGNPFEGFKVYNQQAEKYLNAAEAGAVVGASAQDFFLTESPHGTNGFYMQAKDGDYQQYRFNRQDNEVKYWISADAGSTFMVELRDDSKALNDLVTKAEKFISSQDQGTTVGYITEDSKTAISKNIADAKTAIDNKSGYLAAQASLQAALDGVVTIQPEEGKFYYIASAMPGDGYCSGKKMYVNATGGMKFETAENKMGNIFQFKSAGEGKFYLYNVERDAYLNSNNGHNGGQVTVGVDSEAKPVTITNMGKENVVKIVPVGGAMLHAREIESQIIAFDIDNVDGASAWKIVEVEAESLNEFAYNLNIDEYKTLFLNYNVVIPEGVTAYAVTGVAETNVLQMTELAGVVPAKTAVVVYAENSGDYAFKYTTTAGAAPEGNLLQGSVKNTYVEGAAYVLANGNKGVGLYKAALNKDADGATGTTHFLNNAGKAYLPASAVTSNAAMFSFGRGEGTTSIEDVELINENVVIYDLTGRRVEKMEKGIYIVNGKKVLVM